MNFSKERSYVLSASFEKQQAGNCFLLRWCSRHSQQTPFRGHPSYVHGQFSKLFFNLHFIGCNIIIKLFGMKDKM